MLRDFKLGYVVMSAEKGIEQADTISLDFSELEKDEDCLVIPAYDTTKEQYEELRKMQKEEARKKYNEKQKRRRLKNPTRAMKKKELQKRIDEEREDDFER